MATFLVDMPSRELVPNFLIWRKLSPRLPGAQVFMDEQDHFFGKHGSNLGARLARDRDFIFTPSFNVRRTPSVYLRAKLKGLPLVVYHSEQFFQPYYDREKLNTDAAERFAQVVDLHLVWGDFFRERLIKVGVPAERIVAVGSIKNEVMLRKRLLASSPASSSAAAEGQRYDYLFLSSFSIADLTDQDWTTFRRQFSLGPEIDERINARVCRAGMLDFVRRLAKAAPAKRILVRRHPGEPDAPYKLALADLPNVTLSKLGAIADDILASGLALLQDSTSVFELEAAGRNWISINFADSEELYRCEPRQAFPRHDADLVLERLLSGDIGALLGSPQIAEHGIEHFIGPSDIEVSSRIAAAIAALQGRGAPKPMVRADIEAMTRLRVKAMAATAATTPLIGYLPPLPTVRRRLEANSGLWAAGEHEFTSADLAAAEREAAALLQAGADRG